MEFTRVIAIRHGETSWNVDARIQGQLDVPLNDVGLWQARQLAGALTHEPIAAVYASDLGRAYQTALPVAAAAGLLPVADRGLRERAFGIFEGHTFRDIEVRWPAEALRWRRRDPSFGPVGGEVLADFYDRCIAAASRLAAAHPGQTIALVAHGGVLDSLYRAAMHLDLDMPRTWKVGNASINRLLYAEGGFSVVGWSDTHHLQTVGIDEGSDGDTALGGEAQRPPARSPSDAGQPGGPAAPVGLADGGAS